MKLQHFILSLKLLIIMTLALVLYKRFFSLTPKEKPVKFTITKSSKILNVWFAQTKNNLIVFTSQSNSKTQNKFNNKVLNQKLGGTNFSFFKLFIVNFGKTPIEYNEKANKLILSNQKQSFSNIELLQHLKKDKNNYLYFSTFLPQNPIASGHWKQFLLAFPRITKTYTSVVFKWQEKEIQLKKTECFRKDFYEFLQKPKIDFFHAK